MNTALALALISMIAAVALFPFDVLDLVLRARWQISIARDRVWLRVLGIIIWWEAVCTWGPAAWRTVRSAVREALRAAPTPSEWRTYQASQLAQSAYERSVWVNGRPPIRPTTVYVPSWEILAVCDGVIPAQGQHVPYDSPVE